ncbi:MAG: C39 family peptidase [Bacillota bacterium]|nr:C39 family peptidase [Bacillota bacterium]
MSIFLKKAVTLFHSILFLIVILMVIVATFMVDNSKTLNVAKAMGTFNNWVHMATSGKTENSETHSKIMVIKIKDQVLLDLPSTSQYPQLPRGCEVTSLSMLLNAAGLKINKLELAEKVKKEKTPMTFSNGQIYYGNPNDGFVGSMQKKNQPGFGVYHKPIAELAEKYLPGKIKDITGSDFQDLKIYLSAGNPIWVITNTSYQRLPENQFQTWNTPNGSVKVTFKEHSVLLTGYDLSNVYFNDPLTGEKNKKAPIKDFEASWVQMGRQAITYLP